MLIAACSSPRFGTVHWTMLRSVARRLRAGGAGRDANANREDRSSVPGLDGSSRQPPPKYRNAAPTHGGGRACGLTRSTPFNIASRGAHQLVQNSRYWGGGRRDGIRHARPPRVRRKLPIQRARTRSLLRDRPTSQEGRWEPARSLHRPRRSLDSDALLPVK